MSTKMYAPATGAGMAMINAATFGKKAKATKATPITTPTRLAATPVNSASEMLVE